MAEREGGNLPANSGKTIKIKFNRIINENSKK
jgi:hypothetical protein